MIIRSGIEIERKTMSNISIDIPFMASFFLQATLRFLLILLINQIHHHLHHHIFLLGPTFGNHQREGNEGVVGYALVTVLCVKHMVVVEKP